VSWSRRFDEPIALPGWHADHLARGGRLHHQASKIGTGRIGPLAGVKQASVKSARNWRPDLSNNGTLGHRPVCGSSLLEATLNIAHLGGRSSLFNHAIDASDLAVDLELNAADGQKIDSGFGLAGPEPVTDLELPLPDTRYHRGYKGVFDAFVIHGRSPARFGGGQFTRQVVSVQYYSVLKRTGKSSQFRDELPELNNP
jgi:hypothetical protein